MPTIHIEMLTGRTVDQKRALAKELTESFVKVCGGNPNALQIVIREVERENWASGGQLIIDRQA